MIGVFDSGLGGLTILKEFLRVLPEYDYLYLGDNARAPYGNKSDELIYEYSRQAVGRLFKQGCELVIIACHTASARALRRLQQEYLPANHPEKKVLGVAVPVVEQAKKISRYGRVGVIGTRATIESKIYEKELAKLGNSLEVYEQACPLLVPLIEEGRAGKPECNLILKKYLRPLKVKKIDTLILACTHYPFLLKDIKRIMGKNVKIINPATVVAEKLKDYLARHPEIGKKLGKNKQRVFYTTDSLEKFKSLGQKFLGGEIGEVEKAIL
ncbi:MAG: glutamate racemase [bacterium]|nr:glutamate racemase [bacterium]